MQTLLLQELLATTDDNTLVRIVDLNTLEVVDSTFGLSNFVDFLNASHSITSKVEDLNLRSSFKSKEISMALDVECVVSSHMIELSASALVLKDVGIFGSKGFGCSTYQMVSSILACRKCLVGIENIEVKKWRCSFFLHICIKVPCGHRK